MKTATRKNTKMIEMDLISRGDYYHGGDATHVATEWADAFSASEAAAWMDVGFWSASTASSIRDIGYTPAEIKTISDSQTDAGISYSSGDLIYALCNSDACPDDISSLESVSAADEDC